MKENRLDDREIDYITHSFYHSSMCYASVILTFFSSFFSSTTHKPTPVFTTSYFPIPLSKPLLLFCYLPGFFLNLLCLSLSLQNSFLTILSKIATLPPLFPILMIVKMCSQISSMTVIWQLVSNANSQGRPKPTNWRQQCVL